MGCVCALAGRLDDALLHNETITDKALRQASVAERPVALPPVHSTEGSHPWPHCFSSVHKLIGKYPPASRPTRKAFAPLESLRASWKATLKVDCRIAGGARDRRARSVPRQRYSCRDRPVGACLARMGPFRPSAKAAGGSNFLFEPSLSPRTKGEDES
jgi:hypothetical protein